MLFSASWTSLMVRLVIGAWCTSATCAILIAQGAAQPDPKPAAAQDFEDIVVHVPSMAIAGKVLREVGIAKTQEGIPQGDAEPTFDTQNNRLYFSTSRAHAATMKKILARIEKGAPATSQPAERQSAEPGSSAPPSAPVQVFAIEFWLVQMKLPKGESLDLAGPRSEVVTILNNLEKESKAEVLDHVYLTAEEGKSAQSTFNETVPMIRSMSGSGVWMGGAPPRSEAEARGGGPGGRGPVSTSVSRESLGTQFKVIAQSVANNKVMLDYVVTKTFLGKEEEGTLIPTDSAGGGVRQPTTRLIEIESAVRAQTGQVVTASSQMRGGEKPSEIRVLVLVNPL